MSWIIRVFKEKIYWLDFFFKFQVQFTNHPTDGFKTMISSYLGVDDELGADLWLIFKALIKLFKKTFPGIFAENSRISRF